MAFATKQLSYPFAKERRDGRSWASRIKSRDRSPVESLTRQECPPPGEPEMAKCAAWLLPRKHSGRYKTGWSRIECAWRRTDARSSRAGAVAVKPPQHGHVLPTRSGFGW